MKCIGIFEYWATPLHSQIVGFKISQWVCSSSRGSMYCYYLPLCHLVAVHCTVEDGKILNGQGPLQGRGKKKIQWHPLLMWKEIPRVWGLKWMHFMTFKEPYSFLIRNTGFLLIYEDLKKKNTMLVKIFSIMHCGFHCDHESHIVVWTMSNV